jgi:hypothetical protein
MSVCSECGHPDDTDRTVFVTIPVARELLPQLEAGNILGRLSLIEDEEWGRVLLIRERYSREEGA